MQEPPTKTNSKLASMLKISCVRIRFSRRRRRDGRIEEPPTKTKSRLASMLRLKVGGNGEGGEG